MTNWLNTAEAAKYLGMSSRFLEINRSKGNGPPFFRPSPKAIKYRKEDLDKWISERIHYPKNEGVK